MSQSRENHQKFGKYFFPKSFQNYLKRIKNRFLAKIWKKYFGYASGWDLVKFRRIQRKLFFSNCFKSKATCQLSDMGNVA
jgi:hypothetical protein